MTDINYKDTLEDIDYEELLKCENCGDYLLALYEKKHIEENLILYLSGVDPLGLEKAEHAKKFVEEWGKIRKALDEMDFGCKIMEPQWKITY